MKTGDVQSFPHQSYSSKRLILLVLLGCLKFLIYISVPNNKKFYHWNEIGKQEPRQSKMVVVDFLVGNSKEAQKN